jgi:hypothetical protein
VRNGVADGRRKATKNENLYRVLRMAHRALVAWAATETIPEL